MKMRPIRLAGGLLVLLASSLLQSSLRVQAAPAAVVPDPRFGVVEAHAAPARAGELGAAWSRVRFNWALIQPENAGQWTVGEITEGQLASELASGREVVGLLIGIPEWARGLDGLPAGLYEPVESPANLWAAFVREAASRYAGRIDHWIIWNEPDVWDETHAAYTWPGDVDDFVRLMKVAYLVAKDANPDSVIHMAAMSHWWDALYGRDLYFPRLLDAIISDPDAAASSYFYDVATLHLYFNPAQIYEIAESYAQYQTDRGLDKPFWLVETNAAPSSDPAWIVAAPTFRVSQLEQAVFFPQAFALALAAGVERIGIYKLVDTPGDYAANPEPFGLVRADNTLRPAFATVQTSFELFAGATRAVWNERHLVAQVALEKPGQLVRVLWSRVPQAYIVSLPAFTGSATLRDSWGNERIITPEGGSYSVTVLAGECQETTGDYCMIGGPPVFIIEDFDAGAMFDGGELPAIQAELMPPAAVESQTSAGASRWLRIVIVVIVAGFFELVIRRKAWRALRTRREGS